MKKLNLFVLLLSVALFSNLAMAQEQTSRKLAATLTGMAEVPGPGDTDGTGTAGIQINQGQGQLCYELNVTNISTPSAAHIHEGVAGQAGPVVVTLSTPSNGSSKNCLAVAENILRRMIQNPEGFYVNVHNEEFRDGAVRGQLVKND